MARTKKFDALLARLELASSAARRDEVAAESKLDPEDIPEWLVEPMPAASWITWLQARSAIFRRSHHGAQCAVWIRTLSAAQNPVAELLSQFDPIRLNVEVRDPNVAIATKILSHTSRYKRKVDPSDITLRGLPENAPEITSWTGAKTPSATLAKTSNESTGEIGDETAKSHN